MKPEDSFKKAIILLAEDDDDDSQFTAEAFRKVGRLQAIHRVRDGVELMDYLLRRGNYEDPQAAPRPSLILLDINMPRMDGCEALEKIKSHPELKLIPIVILTTSGAREDIIKTYDLGASSFIQKPDYGECFQEVIRMIADYWLGHVELPAV